MAKKEVRKAVVTDGGYATRFFPVTKTVPKCMLPVLDKPIAHHVIIECMQAGITEIILVATQEGKDFYDDYFHNTVQHIYEQLTKQNKTNRFEKIREVFSLPNVIVIAQDKTLPYGTAAPIISAMPYLGDEPFLHLYADDMVLGESACKELVDEYHRAPDDVAAIIAAKHMPNIDVTKYGIIKIKDNTENELEAIIEKPSVENAPSRLISFGRFIYTPEIFNYLSADKQFLGKDNELWMVDAVWRMAKEKKVTVKSISGEWKTTGDPLNYLKTIIDYALTDPDFNGEFRDYLKDIVAQK